jgi:MFS transporter, PPP family, 3-phenylpropionic acid transporter
MSMSPQIPTGAAFAWRLAAYYAALFMALGVQLPFLPVWLAAKGLDPASVGVVLAIPMVVRVFAIPLVARAADRHNALRAVIMIASAAAVLGYGALGLASSLIIIGASFAVASSFYTPLMPLADAYALRGLQSYERSYGPVRLWGSVAFIAGSLAAGLLLDVVAPRQLIWIMVAALVITAAAACALAPLADERLAASPGLPRAHSPLRDSRFLAVAAGAGLIQASHAIYYGFSTLAWRAEGLDGTAIGGLWAIGVMAEIILFAFSARLPLGPTALLLVGAAGAAIRWGAMAFNPPPLILPFLQCLHGLSFGATHLGALAYVVRSTPAELGASAQGYLAVVLGLVMAVAMGVSGFLYAHWEGRAYAIMALAAAMGGVLVLAGSSRRSGTWQQARGR